MTRRERVMAALNFQPTDKLPKDLSGMRSTGISCFAYPKLIDALGLAPRLPRVYDTGQMLALPDTDVLDALDCDVVVVEAGVTNAFPQPEIWHDYNFNGRLQAQVQRPDVYTTLPDGTISMDGWATMVPSGYVFNAEHAGQSIDFIADLPLPDLKAHEERLKQNGLITDEYLDELVKFLQKARANTDRAIFASLPYLNPGISIGAFGGIGVFPILCIEEPELVGSLHELSSEYAAMNATKMGPAIAPYVDVLMATADDWGTQNSLMASPAVFRELFLPYFRKFNDAMHASAPDTKIFMHSCGAIYDIIDMIIEAKFDVLNPVQWSAGKQGYAEWKEKVKGRIAFWGGGVDSQHTLPLGSVDDVVKEIEQVLPIMKESSGYVFCNIHNILAEIEPEKVIAMYGTAGRY